MFASVLLARGWRECVRERKLRVVWMCDGVFKRCMCTSFWSLLLFLVFIRTTVTWSALVCLHWRLWKTSLLSGYCFVPLLCVFPSVVLARGSRECVRERKLEVVWIKGYDS